MIVSNPVSNSVRRLLISDDKLQFKKLMTLLGSVEEYN